MPTRRARVRAFVWLLYGMAAFEVVLAVRTALDSAVGAAIILALASFTAFLTRWFWRDFERRGPDDPRYSWRALRRTLRS